MQPQSEFASTVASWIRRDIPGVSGACLPGSRALARHYGVSPMTILAALRVLQAAGVVKLYPKRKPLIAGREPGLPKPKPGADETPYRVIREDITTGVLPVGTFFPKLPYYTSKSGSSSYLVRKACNRLVREGLLHRRGRRILVGPAHAVAAPRPVDSVPVIGLAGSVPWRNLWNNPRVRAFCDAFANETERYGVRLEPLRPADLPVQLRGLTRKLGTRYLGTLVYGTSTESFRVTEAISTILRIGRPVVLFDSNDTVTEGLPDRRLFTRYHYSESVFAGKAIEFLRQHNHTRIGYLVTSRSLTWQSLRATALHQACQLNGMSFTEHCMDIRDYRDPLHSGIERTLDDIRARGPLRVKRALKLFTGNRQRLLSQLGKVCPADAVGSPYAGFYAYTSKLLNDKEPYEPSLTSTVEVIWSAVALMHLVDVNHVTAVVAPNDATARTSVIPWLRWYGLEVPRDCSLIAFDNADRAFLQPLTSVDPGFGSAGYQAFHRIMGVLPSTHHRSSSNAAPSTVVDRGSVRSI